MFAFLLLIWKQSYPSIIILHQALSRATNGKGIILSSGARAAFELRGPYDVINLGTLMGLTQEQAKVRCLLLMLITIDDRCALLP